MHAVVRYRALAGVDGFALKWVAGWIGAWLGSPVLGYWWFQVQRIYIIPALLGAFVGAFSCVALMKANALSASKVTAQKATTTPVAREMLKLADLAALDPDCAERAVLQLFCGVPVTPTTLTGASERGGASSGRRFQQTGASFP